jgi:uncharacterized protein (DUF427 family)
MGLSWQQGPLSSGPVGRFLTAQPLPERLLFAEPARRRMRVLFNGTWIADSENVILLHEPGHYPVAFFPIEDISPDSIISTDRMTKHRELGDTAWFAVEAADRRAERAAWQYTGLPEFADILADHVAFAWRAMDAFFEEDERILGHAADAYHRVDVRKTSRRLVVKQGDAVIADSAAPFVLYESGFAPRWYVPSSDVDASQLSAVEGQTFCPYKGLASYYQIGDVAGAAWGYLDPYEEAARIGGMISFESDKVEVYLDGLRQHLAPGQLVTAHGIDRGLDADEVLAHPGGI